MSQQRIVKGDDLSACRPTQVVPVSEHHVPSFVPEGAAAPTIECIKEGNVVRYIDVRCACGQITRLVCDYGVEPAHVVHQNT